MKILPLVRAEFARLTSSRIGIASLIALMTVPVIYGGVYLWGNQDPYSNLDRVPAALVVQDTGTTVHGTAVDYGEKTARSLLVDRKFDWVGAGRGGRQERHIRLRPHLSDGLLHPARVGLRRHPGLRDAATHHR
jgi:hypothetical protein